MLKYFNNLKLRAKFMIGISSFAAFFMFVVTLIFTIKMYQASVANQEIFLEKQADITAQSIGPGLDFGDKASVMDAFAPIKGSLEFIIVYDNQGAAFATHFRQGLEVKDVEELIKSNTELWRKSGRADWLFDGPNMQCIVRPVKNSVGNEIGTLVMAASDDPIMSQLRSDIFFSIGLLIVTVSAGLGGAYAFSNVFAKPISTIVERLRDIAEGEGDLTKRLDIKAKDEVGELAQMFNLFVDKLQDLIRQVQTASTQIGSSVEVISSTTTTVADGADKQSNQATLVAVAAEEMSATIVQTSSNTSDAVNISKQAHDAAKRGREVVDDTVQGLQRISSVVSDSAKTILELGKTVAEIGKVVEVINDITDQINLLSLNASIEAATAGEYGKGFAVVADEVKKLAERTSQSTTEISHMIESIQKAMANAIRAMERGTKEVDKGQELGGKTAEALQDILQANNQVMEMITNISVSAQEQSHTAEEISKNIENIATITKNTADGVKQIDQTTEALVTQTSVLKALVGRFKLEQNGNGHAS
ncbi:methyl-accepting chemotaxis protein [bacterium]|nr:methyl-accepting chemotaxis protein [bacterium]